MVPFTFHSTTGDRVGYRGEGKASPRGVRLWGQLNRGSKSGPRSAEEERERERRERERYQVERMCECECECVCVSVCVVCVCVSPYQDQAGWKATDQDQGLGQGTRY